MSDSPSTHSVTLDVDEEWCRVKIQCDEWEVNFRGHLEEIMQLGAIESADWVHRRSIQAGTSAGSKVFWSWDGTRATMLVSEDDDETWDIAVVMPGSVVHEIWTSALAALTETDIADP